MEPPKKELDNLGRLICITVEQNGNKTIKSVRYAALDQPSRIASYKVEKHIPDNRGDYQVYDGFGKMTEDGYFLEGLIGQKRTYRFDPVKKRYDIDIYMHGGSENPVPVNRDTTKEVERIDFTKEFVDFFPKRESTLDRVEQEAKAQGFQTPAELYQARTEGRQSEDVASVVEEEPEPAGEPEEGTNQPRMIY